MSDSSSVGTIASAITTNLESMAKLVTAGSYVAGLGFSVASIAEFKAHKDNPTQIPVGTPAALVAVSAALLYLPTIMSVAGQTAFGTSGGSASDVKAAAASAGITSSDVKTAATSAGITSSEVSAAESAAKEKLSG